VDHTREFLKMQKTKYLNNTFYPPTCKSSGFAHFLDLLRVYCLPHNPVYKNAESGSV